METSTLPRQPFLRRPATPADASMHRATLEDERIREDRQLNSDAVVARSRADVEKVRVEKDYSMQERAIDVLREQLSEARSNQGAADPTAMIRAMSEVLKAQAPKDGAEHVATMLEHSREEIQRMAEASKAELKRVMEQGEQERDRLRNLHQQDTERLNDAHKMALAAKDREIAIERDRGDSLRRDLEDRHHREVESLKAEQVRSMEMAQRDADRRVADAERTLKAQIDAEAKAHERELRSMESNHSSKSHVDKTLLDEKLRIANEENLRLNSEIVRLNHEIKERGDLPTQIQKFTDTASALGFEKSGNEGGGEEAPKDWKGSLIDIAKEVAPRFPDILRAAGEIVQKRNALPVQAPAPQMHQQVMHQNGGMVAPLPGPPVRRLAFATQDNELAPQPSGSVAPTPITAAMYAPSQQTVPPPPVQSQAIVTVPPPPVQAATIQPEPMSQPMQPTTPPQQAQTEEEGPTDAEILMFRDAFEDAVNRNIKPLDFVKMLVAQHGTDAVRGIAMALKPERITLALQRSPQAAGSPLLKFNGKRWIRETLKLASEAKS